MPIGLENVNAAGVFVESFVESLFKIRAGSIGARAVPLHGGLVTNFEVFFSPFERREFAPRGGLIASNSGR